MIRILGRLWSILTAPWVVALFCAAILTLLVWFFGPYIAIADKPVLQSVVSRLVATIVIILGWGFFVALYYSRRKSRELSDPQKAAESEKITVNKALFKEEIQHIKNKFKNAVRIVTTSNFYGSSSRSRYNLPWYLVIGTANSGKTSLLLNSGLQFPLNEQADRHLYNLRSTDRCETLFANQAVFIDTPGSYTGATDSSREHALWITMLKRLFRIRPAKAINGIIVCISTREIMDTDIARREHLARTIRTRLSEVLKTLRTYVPVYLVFTKCDAVPGFAQFFAHLSRAEREQIFGCPMSLDMENANVREEIKEIMRTLNAQIISKVHQERDTASRGEMFSFPQELASLGSRIEDFIFEAFGPSRYHKPVMFRGFFFTSALSVQDVLTSSAQEGELYFQSGFQPSLGDYAKGFFLLRFLQDLVIPEARLANSDKEHIWYLRLKRYGLQMAAAGAFLFVVFFLGISFINNYSRITDIDAVYKDFYKTQTLMPSPHSSKSVLPELNELERSITVFNPDKDSAITYGLGLYRGNTFDKAANKAYLDALNVRLADQLRKEASTRIDASLNNLNELKQSLRAYMMLCQPKHLKEATLMPWLKRQWSDLYLGEAPVQASLEHHTLYLVENGIVPVEPDAALLERARRALLKVPLAEIAYEQMKEEAVESGKPPFTFRAQLGDASSIFMGDTYPIPYLYTRSGYEEYCITRCPLIIANLTQDSWIFGSNPITLSAIDISKIYKDVRAMYFRDYIQHWNSATQALHVVNPADLRAAAKTADLMTTGISPVTMILRELQSNTDLILSATPEDKETSVEDAVMDQLQRKASHKIGKMAGSQAGKAIASQGREKLEEVRETMLAQAMADSLTVKQHFQPLVSLLTSEGNAAHNLKAAHDNMVETGKYFNGLIGDDMNQRVFNALLEIADGKNDTLRHMEQAAEKLPAPVGTWYRIVSEDGFNHMLTSAAANINSVYQERVRNIYNRDLSAHYPFNGQSDSDANLDSFSGFFRAGGILDSFHESHIRPFVNGNGTLRSIRGRTLPLAHGAIAQLNRANRVKHAFFASGRDLGINFMIEPYALDASLKQVDLTGGGKTLGYWHGLVTGANYVWPQKGELAGQTSLTMTDLNGMTQRKEARGEWALFRLLQAGTIKRQENNTCLMEVQINGKWAQYLIQFRNQLNPFDPAVSSFTLPASLR